MRTGGEQVQMLSGKAADPKVIAALTWVAMTHHPAIMLVDTVRAYHVGAGIQAEVGKCWIISGFYSRVHASLCASSLCFLVYFIFSLLFTWSG